MPAGRALVGERASESLEFLTASFLASLIGLSLYLDLRRVFDVGLPSVLLLTLSAFAIHEFSHKLGARGLAGGGRFSITLTGSFYSLFLASFLNAWGLLAPKVYVLLGLKPGEPYRLVPFRLMTLGTVIMRGRRRKEVVGRVALLGPSANLALGWLMFSLAWSMGPLEFFLVGSALNAYTALSALLPLAFCDGLSIYWWSKKAWLLSLLPTVGLVVLSNALLLIWA